MRNIIKGRHLRFWGRYMAETLGLSVGAALLWFCCMLIGRGGYVTGSMTEELLPLIPCFPYYLIVGSAMIAAIMGGTFLQTHFSILVSMTATRKQSIFGICAGTAAENVIVLVVCAAVWKMIPGDISASGREVLPLLAGGMFVVTALFLLFGAVRVRWGNLGIILTTVLLMLMGGLAGMLFALSDGRLIEKFLEATQGRAFLWVLLLGIVFYLAAGAAIWKITCKAEVHT